MRIHAIKAGTITLTERQRRGHGRGIIRLLNTLLERTWTEPLPDYVWVIEHPEGIIIVDTGGTVRALQRGFYPWWHPYFKLYWKSSITLDEEVGPQLQALGIDPEEVRWVILTHLETTGGLHYFPSSEILVSRKEYEFARGFTGQIRGYVPHRWPSWFVPRLIDFESSPIGPFPESFVLTEAGDVCLIPTEGHTRGHMSVILQDQGTAFFFAGDASYTEQFMLDQVVDGVCSKERAARLTLKRILQYVKDTPTVYLPGRDPNAAYRLAARSIVSF